MPGVIGALAESAAISILTKGTLSICRCCGRPWPVPGEHRYFAGRHRRRTAEDTRTGHAVKGEAGADKDVADAGFARTSWVAPVPPYLSDSVADLDIAAACAGFCAGASGVTAFPLHLRGAAMVAADWLAVRTSPTDAHPALPQSVRAGWVSRRQHCPRYSAWFAGAGRHAPPLVLTSPVRTAR